MPKLKVQCAGDSYNRENLASFLMFRYSQLGRSSKTYPQMTQIMQIGVRDGLSLNQFQLL